jgi:hypothetical protein
MFWPFALPVTPEHLEASAKLVRLRGEFWSKAFEAVAEMADEWSKALRDKGGQESRNRSRGKKGEDSRHK